MIVIGFFCYKYVNRLLINLIIVGIIQIFQIFAPFNIVWVINIEKDYDLHNILFFEPKIDLFLTIKTSSS